jgi:hypothetical protein
LKPVVEQIRDVVCEEPLEQSERAQEDRQALTDHAAFLIRGALLTLLLLGLGLL